MKINFFSLRKQISLNIYTYLLLLIFNCNFGVAQVFTQNFWQQTNMPAHLSIYAMATDNDGNIYAGGYGQGLYKSTDNGTTWSSAGMEGYWIKSISVNQSGDVFLVGLGDTYGRGIFKSVDNAETWTKVFGFDDNYGGINCVYVAADNTVWVGLNYSPSHNGIFRSTDNGSSWENVFTDLKNFNTIVVNSQDVVFAGSYGRIYYSPDNGLTWSYSEEGLIPSKITAMAVNQNDQVFAASAGSGIFRTDDNGNSWNGIASAGDDYSCLLIDGEENIYAGSQGYWVRRSMDNGENWDLINSGLTNQYILSLTIDKDGYLYAGSDTSGVFRSKVPVPFGIPQHIESTFELSVYPNPSQDCLKIDYVLLSSDELTLSIYNASGEAVKILVKEKQTVGEYQLNVSTSDLPAGVYLYVFQVGKFTQSKKIIIL